MMKLVTLSHLSLSNAGFVVILKSDSDPRSVPIFIGMPEAQAIAIPLNHIHPARPLTHDLMKSLLDLMECRIEHVEIRDVRNGTFFAAIIALSQGMELAIDSRPSDAIALALRCQVPILVEEKVIAESGIIVQNEEDENGDERAGGEEVGEKTAGQGNGAPEPAPEAPWEEVKTPPPVVSVLEQMKRRLAAAIHEERYEDAARVRDEIRNFASRSPESA